MKHLLYALAAFALLLAFLFPCALADEIVFGNDTAHRFAYVINPNPGERLNLRAAPRSDAVSLGKYYTGSWIELLGAPKDGWVKVSIEPLEGYMNVDYLTQDLDRVRIENPRLTVAPSDGAPIYEQPDETGDILTTYKQGETVAVLAVRDDQWLHVIGPSYYGFMRASDLNATLSYHSGGNAVQVEDNSYAVVNNPDPKDRLNLRAAPHKDADVLAKYYSGTIVTLLGEEENGFVKVRIGGTAEGYMLKKYLECNGNPVQSAMLSVAIANDEGSGMNLRAGRSTSSQSLGFYRDGTVVQVMGTWGEWCHVIVDGQKGYMLTEKFENDYGLTFKTPGQEG